MAVQLHDHALRGLFAPRSRLAWLVVSAGLGLPRPLAAQPVNAAPCSLGVTWQVTHADGVIAQATIEQSGSHFRGSATRFSPPLKGALYDGRVKGRVLSFHIQWSNGQDSAYRGYILPDGRVEGSHRDLAAPGSHQLWILKQRVKC